jgi:hypothetical protein
MKTKIGTVLEADVVRKLKEFSAKRGQPINEVIQEAVVTYIQGGANRNQQLRLAALKRLCSKPFNLSHDDWKEIMEEDYYEQ